MREETEDKSYRLKNRLGRLYGTSRNFDKTGSVEELKRMLEVIAEMDKILRDMIKLESQQTLIPATIQPPDPYRN